ncbi:FAD-dependent oxidoreductase [Rossellomorea aquimaris]|uniref:FAD-dependent oxidoreductase n=1 Tax=Rossellomorea aquimaris TaxID=189382 RepID=UPI001CD67544|nr:FAD-dependent oxidoreductase [Rossellomorea aquimaris]MCA1055013.1 FAD-dependent oxidoreductase [Rossellomorea aquimaris]
MDTQHQAFNQAPEPLWRETVQLPTFPKLSENIKPDVTVVGGGIAGITTAHLLSTGGKKVALIDAGRLLNGTTGHTTAKITAQHGLIYDELINHFGEEFTKSYFEGNSKALSFMEGTIESGQIDCDYQVQDAYLYSTTDMYKKKIEKEFEAYQKLGIDSELVEALPIDLPVKNAVVMKKQAQFHPLKYFKVLIDGIINNGGQIFEGTLATTINENDRTQVVTEDGYHLDSEYVVIATHFPFYDGMGVYFARMKADRSYTIAAKTRKTFPGGMYLSAEDPTRSLRSTFGADGEELVLIGGDNHKTGQGTDTMNHYRALEDFGNDVFGIDEIKHHWSAQDLITIDKIPYIGPLTEKHPSILVATGFRKWGMTLGTLAGQILSDHILGNHNLYRDLFKPSRFKADPGIKHLAKENANVAAQLIKGKLDMPTKRAEDLKKGEGAVILVNGKRCGGYRDENGKLSIVDTTCTHLGCECAWNHGDRTWDCPCHGSRFATDGSVIEGPAKKPLSTVDAKE